MRIISFLYRKMGKRVSLEQRQMLLAFLQGHEDLARGRVSGPDAARTKKNLLEELAEQLNALGSGSTKSPEKWFRSWQDWKSDTKAKAMKINKYRAGTGGVPCLAPLSPLEENLFEFFGVEMVEGLQGVPDPLQVYEAFLSEETANRMDYEEPLPVPQPQTRPNRDDALYGILARQATALEDVASGMHNIAAALKQIAAALQPEVLLPLNES